MVAPLLGQPQQNTPDAIPNPGSDRIEVTMPIHPFFGKKLGMVRREKDQNGKQFVYVEHPAVGFLRLPIEWTSLSANTGLLKFQDREGKIEVNGLKKLAMACTAALSEKVDDCGGTMNPVRQFNGKNERTDEFKSQALGEPARAGKTSPDRCMGHSDSQSDSGTGQGEVQ